MSRHFLKYWLYSAVERQMKVPHRRVNYSASDQYKRLDVGDHLWVVTVPPRTQSLLLFGHMIIGWIGDRTEAARRLGTEASLLRDANIHILADPDFTEPYDVIDITSIALDLRFESSMGRDRLPGRGWPQALQTMRVLAPETVSLFREVWYSSGEGLTPIPDPFVPTLFLETRQKIEMHQRWEHDPLHLAAVKQQFLQNHGDLFCEACGFNFSQLYGTLGEEFIELHHTQPLAEIDDTSVPALDDFALVCANCHRMLHRHKPWLTVEALRVRLQQRP